MRSKRYKFHALILFVLLCSNIVENVKMESRPEIKAHRELYSPQIAAAAMQLHLTLRSPILLGLMEMPLYTLPDRRIAIQKILYVGADQLFLI